MAFAENLRKYREKMGVSARQLAKGLCIPYTTYLNYENGNSEPKFSTLMKIAHALMVSTDTLLGYEFEERDEVQQALNILQNNGYRVRAWDTFRAGDGCSLHRIDHDFAEREKIDVPKKLGADSSKIKLEYDIKDSRDEEAYTFTVRSKEDLIMIVQRAINSKRVERAKSEALNQALMLSLILYFSEIHKEDDK